MHVCLGSKVLIAEGFNRPGPNNGLGGLSFGNKHLRLGYKSAPMLSGRS